MSRKSGAQAGEGRLESRFAALTSGLLARKGQAAPSNSPIVDAAEETEAFTLSDALIPRKNAPRENKAKAPSLSPPASQSTAQSPSAAARAVQPAPPAPSVTRPAPTPAPAPSTAPKAQTGITASQTPAPAPRPAAAKPAPLPQPMTIINERSFEAGYPDNPTVEEIEANEAEADEAVTYLDSAGGDAAPDGFFDDAGHESERDPLDELDDIFDEKFLSETQITPETAPRNASAPVRASVHAQLGVREFMRLSLGATELRLSVEQLIAEAIEEYLDARGVDSLGGEEFLKKLAAAAGEKLA